MDRHKTGPRHLRGCVCVLTEAETARVTRFLAKVGTIHGACKLLGVSSFVFDAARSFGRMQKSTRDRILAALDVAEAA